MQKMGLEPTRILLPQAPEACASANSATSAFLIYQSLSRDCSFIITDVWIKSISFFEIFLILPSHIDNRVISDKLIVVLLNINME